MRWGSRGSASDGPDGYALKVIDLLERDGVFSSAVDWESVRAGVSAAIRATVGPQEIRRLLAGAVYRAGGRHSGLRDPAGRRVDPGAPSSNPVRSHTQSRSARRSRGTVRPSPTVRVVDGVAVLSLPSCAATNAASYVRAGARALASSRPVALGPWVLDLRENHGGAMWPMLAVAAPLLPIGRLGQFVMADGTRLDWILETNRVRQGASTRCRCPLPAGTLSDQPVAVLIGARTVSSGEAVAVAFRARPGTRFFGAPTCGYPSVNSTYPLPDGSLLILTTGWFVDAAGRTYTDRLEPDETSTTDPIAQAITWARNNPQRSA